MPDKDAAKLQTPRTGTAMASEVREEEKRLEALERAAPSSLRRRLQTLTVLLEVAFIAGLLVVWLTSQSIHHSNSLWVLFFYCFPSQFLLAAVPHEPILLYFGKFYHPLTVALVATAGTVITEVINYSVFKYVADFKAFKKVSRSRLMVKSVALFKKAPFLALWVAGLTPVPYYPFRFMVVVARYPLPLFALAVFTSRLPRFFILALLGNKFDIPNWVIIALFAVLVLVAVVPLVREFLRKADGERSSASP